MNERTGGGALWASTFVLIDWGNVEKYIYILTETDFAHAR